MSIMDPTSDRGENEDEKSGLAIHENVAMGTVSMNTTSTASPFQQHPPPSPLSGCYLLVVLPEPHTASHKDLIISRLAKGFLSWNKDSCHVDLTKELQALVTQSPEGEEARNGERLIQYATENLVTEILIHPQTNTLLQCIRNLLASFTKHRHIIHAGYTFSENGSWILQDGTFSFADFLDAFNEHDVQRVLRAYENSVTVDINCAAIGDWSEQRFSKEPYTRSCRIRLNPDDVLTAGMPAITSFSNYISQYLVAQELDELMQPSDVVGNIRFSHPTLYVFPGGQGDAALFGINGFNMLIDGGFARKSCFWDFTRHLDRLDAVLFTRLNNSNVGGMSSVLKKKREVNVYPQIGHFFCNLAERKHSNSPDGDKDLDPLILSLIDLGQEMMINLKHINLRPHTCYRDPEPINLYHKVGHGTLDMYVLSPTKDCREVKEFLAKWNATDEKLFAGSNKKDANNMTFPIQNLISICALLVWQPANPDDTITRILFPGSAPQHKIFEGLQRLKNLEFLNHPSCTAKSMSPPTSLVTLKDKSIKQKLTTSDKDIKRVAETKKQKREIVDVKKADSVQHQQPLMTKTKKLSALENKKLDEGKDYPKVIPDMRKNEKIVKEPKRESKKDASKIDKETDMKKSDANKSRTDMEKIAMPKPSKSKTERKKKEIKEMAKPTLKAPKSEFKSDNYADQTIKALTPKKTINGLTPKVEIPKGLSIKASQKPTVKTTTPPAKSAKDANNRKVVEQKNIEKMSSSGFISSTSKPLSKSKTPLPPVQTEKKAVVRRPKPVTSPSKSRSTGSPVKSTKCVPISIKSEKDAVIKKIKSEKGTAESSTVSTPSAIEIDAAKFVDKCLTERSEDMSLDSIESKVLADLKEERQVVEEIEAVLQKAERTECVIMSNEFEGEDETTDANYKKEDDMTEDDVTADIDDIPRKELTSRKPSQEFTEEDEYLIIEKEEMYTESSVHSGEVEHKHILDAAQSEKVEFVQQSHMKTEEVNYKVTVKHAPEKEEEEDGNMEEEEDEEDDDEDDEVEVEVEIEEEDNEDEEKRNFEEIDEEGEEEEEDDEDDQRDECGEKKDVEKGIGEKQEKTDQPENAVLTRPETELKDIVPDECVIEHAEYKEPFKGRLQEDMKEIITFALRTSPKTEDKDDSVRKDYEDITKEVSSLTPEKLDSSEKKTTDTDTKPELDSKEPYPREKLEESQERISTLESGATTTAPTLPEDERIPVEPVKLHAIEKQVVADDPRRMENVTKAEIIPLHTGASEVKSDAKIFVAQQPGQALPRDIVKTPDEVADLPVHEEVDPKLYEMDEFNKSKDEKLTEQKDSKEQKGVFGFFGKVADKFEKSMDKLTGKSRRDSEKDIAEKSSSKSASPKETTDIASVIPKIEHTIEHDANEDEVQEQDPICLLKPESKKSIEGNEICAYEDVKEVEALLEEASKKFKTVKDSLRDSLESLEERVIDEELQIIETAPENETDEIKGTLDEVVEKLTEIKLVSPQSDEFDNEDLEKDPQVCSVKDVKEAMRDVGEVLAGTAGIVIENKPKDVIEIVKKVAEVLKADDFLSEKTIFVDEPTQHTLEDIVTEAKPTDASHNFEISMDAAISAKQRKESIGNESNESPCMKDMLDTESDNVYASNTDDTTDKSEVKLICLDLMKDDEAENRNLSYVTVSGKEDVMSAGTEDICRKAEILPMHDDVKEQHTETSEITFQQKSRAATAELVTLTPDSLPPSPKQPEEGLRDKTEVEDTRELNEIKVPAIIIKFINEAEDIHKIIERLILVEKIKITTEILEYIIKVKYISRYQILQVIEQIMVENEMTPDTCIPSIQTDESSETKKSAIEQYIDDQYVKKNTKITRANLNDISREQSAPIRIVVQIIEEIIHKKKVPKNSILHINDEELQELLQSEEEKIESETVGQTNGSCEKIPILRSTGFLPIADLESQLENELMTEYMQNGRKITSTFIDNIHQRRCVPLHVITEMIDEIIMKKKLLRQEVVDISDTLWNELKTDNSIEVEGAVTKKSLDDTLTEVGLDIPSGDILQNTGLTVQKTEGTGKVIADDFEAVEQEYKLNIESHESKARSEVEEAMEDDINDAVEADEKVTDATLKEVVSEPHEIILADDSSESIKNMVAQHKGSDFSTKLVQEEEESASEKSQELVSLDAKSVREEYESVSEKSQELISLDTIKDSADVTKHGEDEKVTTVRRMVVTATSEDGGEETELCASEGITFPKDKISDDPCDSSPLKEITAEATVYPHASTPGVDSIPDKSPPEVEKDPQTLDGGNVEEKDAVEMITGIPAKNEQFLPEIGTDVEIAAIQPIPILPVDISPSANMSLSKGMSESTSSHMDEKIITELSTKDQTEIVTEEKQISTSKPTNEPVAFENKPAATIEHSISSSITSDTENDKKAMHEEKSCPVTVDSTSIEENIAHAKTTQSDELYAPLRESEVDESKLQEKSSTLNLEPVEPAASIPDTGNVGGKTLTHIPSRIGEIEVIAIEETFCQITTRAGDTEKREASIKEVPNVPSADESELSVPYHKSQPKSHIGTTNSEDDKLSSPIPQVHSSILNKTDDTNILEDVHDKVTANTNAGENKSTVPSSIFQTSSPDESIIIENVKSSLPTPDLHNLTQIDEKVVEKESTNLDVDQDKSPAPSPERQLTNSNVPIADENEKSRNLALGLSDQTLSKTDSTEMNEQTTTGKSTAPIIDSVKSTVQSAVSQSPDRNGGIANEIIDEEAPSLRADQNVSSVPPPESPSPTEENNAMNEIDHSPTIPPILSTSMASEIDNVKMEEKVINEKTSCPSIDQIESVIPRSLALQPLCPQLDTLIKDDKPRSPTHNLFGPNLSNAENTGMAGETIDEKTRSPTSNRVEPMTLSGPSSSDREKSTNGKQDESSSPTLNEDDERGVDKELIEEKSTTDTVNQFESAASPPVAQSPSCEKSITDEKEESPCLTCDLGTSIPHEAEETKIDEKVMDKKLPSFTEEVVTSISRSPEIPSTSREISIVSQEPQLQSQISDPCSPTASSINVVEIDRKMSDEKGASVSVDHGDSSIPFPATQSSSQKESNINETGKSQSPMQDLISLAPSKISDMKPNEEITEEHSTSPIIDRAKSTASSPVVVSPSHEDNMVGEKEKSLWPPHDSCETAPSDPEDTTSIKEGMNEMSTSPAMVPTELILQSPSHEENIPSGKVESPSSAHDLCGGPSMKPADVQAHAEIINETSTSSTIHQMELIVLPPGKDSLHHEESISSEKDELIREPHDLCRATPSKPDTIQTDTQVINQTSISPNIDQIESVEPSSGTPSTRHEENIPTRNADSPRLPHDVCEVASDKSDDMEIIAKLIKQTSNSPTVDQIESMVSSQGKSSPSSEENITGMGKSQGSPQNLLGATPSTPDDGGTNKEMVDLISTELDQIESIVARPGTQSPSHEENIPSVKNGSLSSLHASYETTPYESDDMKTDKKVITQIATSPIMDEIKSVLPCSGTQLPTREGDITEENDTLRNTVHYAGSPTPSAASNMEIHGNVGDEKSTCLIEKQTESLAPSLAMRLSCEGNGAINAEVKLFDMAHDLGSLNSNTVAGMERDKEVTNNRSTSSVMNQVESLVPSAATQSHLEERTLRERTDPQSPTHDLCNTTRKTTDDIGTELSDERLTEPTTNQIKSMELPAAFPSSQEENISEKDKSPSQTHDACILSSNKADDMIVDLETVVEKSSSQLTDQVQSFGSVVPVVQSPNREGSISRKSDESLESIHDASRPSSRSESSDMSNLVMHGKPNSSNTDEIKSIVLAETTQSLSPEGGIFMVEDNLKRLTQDSRSSTPDEHDNKNIELSDGKSIRPLLYQECTISSPSTQSPTCKESAISGKDESPTLSHNLDRSTLNETDDTEIVNEAIDKTLTSPRASGNESPVSSLVSQLSSYERETIDEREQSSSLYPQLISTKSSKTTNMVESVAVLDEKPTQLSVIEYESLPSISPLSPTRKRGAVGQNEDLSTLVRTTSDRATDITEDKNLRDSTTVLSGSDDDLNPLISPVAISPNRDGPNMSPKDDSSDSKIAVSSEFAESMVHSISDPPEKGDAVGRKADDIHSVQSLTSSRLISSSKEYSTIDDDGDMKCPTSPLSTSPSENVCSKMGAIDDEVSDTETQIHLQLSQTIVHEELPSSPIRQIQPSTSPLEVTAPNISNNVTPTLDTTEIDNSTSALECPRSIDMVIENISDTNIPTSHLETSQVCSQESIDESVVPHRIPTDKENKKNDSIIDPSSSGSTSETSISDEKETVNPELPESSSERIENNYADSSPRSEDAVNAQDTGESIVDHFKAGPPMKRRSIEEKEIPLAILSVQTEFGGPDKVGDSAPLKDIPSRDRSRSHSLYETDEKTPLGRSRVASLFEDKEEIISSLSRLDPQHCDKEPEIPDEHLEHGGECVEYKDQHKITLAKRTDIEQYVLSQYVSRKKKITGDCFEEMVALYDIPKSVLIQIINEICMTKNIDEKSILDYYDDHDESIYEHTATRVDFKLSDMSFVKRLDIEDYITELYIKQKKKMSSKIISEVAASKKVSDDIIFAIIAYLIAKRNIPKESLVEDELWARIQEGAEVIKDEKDSNYDSHHNIDESTVISEKQKIDIETYIMKNYIEKGHKIYFPALIDIEKAMSVSRCVLLEIITKMMEKIKLPQESILDDAIYSEFSCKEHTKERLSCKSTPEHESSGYSTPEVRRYDDKYESQFHKAFVGGMTEIRTTHITTLSGKSTPDVTTRVDTPESLSELPMTPASTPSFNSHVIRETSGPVAIECTIATEDSHEYDTVIRTKTIECTSIRKEGDESTEERGGIDIVDSRIQSPNMKEPNDQFELKTTTATSRKDHIESLLLDNKSGSSESDKTKEGSDCHAHMGTPEGFRTGEIIKTTITTTRTMSEEGEIITTTKEVTETTNEKGETIVTTKKVDVTVADRTPAVTELPSIDAPKSLDACQRSITPGSGATSPRSDPDNISHSRATTHVDVSNEEKQMDSGDDGMGSPMSISSQVYRYDKHDEPVEFSTADMSSSFYGHLPDVPPSRTSNTSMSYSDDRKTEDFTFKKMMPDNRIDVMFSSQHSEVADLDVTKEKYQDVEKKDDDNSQRDTGSSTSKDPLSEWGTPLELPPPERPEKFNLRTVAIMRTVDISPDSLDFDVIHDWGEPMRLPSPTQIAADDMMTNKGAAVTIKKDAKPPRKVISENLKNRKSSESPIRSEKKLREAKNKVQPVYLDLTYVPHHGNSYYASLEFFKRIRARYYVFSGTEPSREVYDALLHAKKTWENKNLEVTIIPTYDTDTLGYWVADNEEALAANHIDLSPSASRCTINLQDHETSCSAYRLEF